MWEGEEVRGVVCGRVRGGEVWGGRGEERCGVWEGEGRRGVGCGRVRG